MTNATPSPLAILPVPIIGGEFVDSYLRIAEQHSRPTHTFSEVAEWVLILHEAGWIDDMTLARVSDDRRGITTTVESRDDALCRLNAQAAARARALFTKHGYDVSGHTTTFIEATVSCDQYSGIAVEIGAAAGLHVGDITAFATTADQGSAQLATAMIQCVVNDSDLLIDQAEVIAEYFGFMREGLIDDLMDERWAAIYDHYEKAGWPEQDEAFDAMIDASSDAGTDEATDTDADDLRDRLHALLHEKYEQINAEGAAWNADELQAMTPDQLRSIANAVGHDTPRTERLSHLACAVASIVEVTPMTSLNLERGSGAGPILISTSRACTDSLNEYGDYIQQGDEYPGLLIVRGNDEDARAYIERLSRTLVAAHVRGLMLEVMDEHGLFGAVEDEGDSHDTGYDSDGQRIAA
ncbi:hypothetical protein J7355_13560 [Endozoicomonas sp. G2_2]|uniref:hypothetical protein n=1 Tax=Endozoicomonas sp. G2_2 TaxID=2821092 RepID=UPI001ADB64F3|nr:hypothetical protein [Endozoicomonas sp. G2_2]MBO9471123.1 hypothetical protein [Endozoicomonas sp. G2_2]